MPATDVFIKAVDAVGGVVKAAEVTGRGQSTISGYLKDGNAPAEVCMRLEVATDGVFGAEGMRPDLADTFRAFRASKLSNGASHRRARNHKKKDAA